MRKSTDPSILIAAENDILHPAKKIVSKERNMPNLIKIIKKPDIY
jgi:hypothetical protein